MHSNEMAAAVEKVVGAQEALACLATQEALLNLGGALDSLESLTSGLTAGPLPEGAYQERLLQSMLELRRELHTASSLAVTGLAFCQDLLAESRGPSNYCANGAVAASGGSGEVSLEA